MRRHALAFALVLLHACSGSSSSLTKPTDLIATPGKGQVTLTWSPVSGAQSYEVSRSAGSAAAATVATPTAPLFVDGNLQNGLVYTYSVRAIAGNARSADSPAAPAMPFRALCLSQSNASQIAVFNGEAHYKPRTFGGVTRLSPGGIALDSVHGVVFSANQSPPSVTSYPASANGNVAPVGSFNVGDNVWTAEYDAPNDQLLVVSTAEILTYDRTAPSAPSRTLWVSNGITFGIGNIVLTGPAHGDLLFAVNVNDEQTIYAYHRGDASPAAGVPVAALATISAPAIFDRRAIAYDPNADELLIGDFSGRILAFPASSNGPATATRILGGSQTGMGQITALAIDGDRHLLYAADSMGKLSTFPSDFAASANIAPDAVLAGPLTRLGSSIETIRVDAPSGNLYVQSSSSILVFPSSPSGNGAAQSSISSAPTGLERPSSLTFDPAHGELLVANEGSVPEISAYTATTAAGSAVTPVRTLLTPLGNSALRMGLAYVPSRDEIVVAQAQLPPRIDVYSRTATEGAAALRTIAGSNTLLTQATALALDAPHDAVVVVDFDKVSRYALSFSDGNEAPLTTISGPHTGLGVDGILSVTVDDQNGEIFVAVPRGVLVFHLTDDGDVAPIRTLSDPGGVGDLVVDPVAQELFVVDNTALIGVYSRTATGAATPLRTIAGFGDIEGWGTALSFCN
jgi:hypothetical protein